MALEIDLHVVFDSKQEARDKLATLLLCRSLGR